MSENTLLVPDVTDSSFEFDVLQSSLPVLVDFWAPWCVPCKAIAPILDRVAAENAGRFKIVKYNIDDQKTIAAQLAIRSVPTLVAYRNGELVGKTTGVSGSQFKELLGKLVGVSEAPADTTAEAFRGDPALKARCIDRLLAAIDDGRLTGLAATSENALENAHLPSSILSGAALGNDDVGGLGIPSPLLFLLDYFHERIPYDQIDPPLVLDWIQSIAVGADLRHVMVDYLQWMLSDPTHGVLKAATPVSGLVALAEQLMAHLQEDVTPNTVADAQWQLLQSRAAAILETTGGLESELCTAIVPVMRSSAVFESTAFVSLIRISLRLAMKETHENWYTDEEAEGVAATHQGMRPFMTRLGPRPVAAEELAVYQSKIDQFIKDSWASLYRKLPAVEAKRAALIATLQQVPASNATQHAAYLLGAFKRHAAART
jgi:thioredoxin 1